MSVISDRHLARRLTVACIWTRYQATFEAMARRLSQLYDDDLLFTVIVVVVGFLPCVLLMFAMFAK